MKFLAVNRIRVAVLLLQVRSLGGCSRLLYSCQRCNISIQNGIGLERHLCNACSRIQTPHSGYINRDMMTAIDATALCCGSMVTDLTINHIVDFLFYAKTVDLGYSVLVNRFNDVLRSNRYTPKYGTFCALSIASNRALVAYTVGHRFVGRCRVLKKLTNN